MLGHFNTFYTDLNRQIKINRTKRSKGQSIGLIKFRSKKSHSDYFYSNYIKLSYNPDCKANSYVKISKIGLVNFKCKNIKPEFLNGKIKFGVVKRTKLENTRFRYVLKSIKFTKNVKKTITSV